MAQIGRAAIVALAALLVVDIGLVALALRHVQASDFGETVAAPSANGGKQEGGKQNGGKQNGGKQDGEGNGGGNGGQQQTQAPETLINIGDGAIGRAVTGSCNDGGAKVELSTDGGASWTEVTPELDVVVRVSVVSADEATVVGATSDCESVTTYTTSDGGGTWAEGDGANTWHAALDGGPEIYSPYGGTSAVPCAEGEGVGAVSMLTNDHVIALCDDGPVQVSTDAGGTWEHVGDLPGATAVDFISDTSGLGAVPNGEGCENGVAVMRTEDGGVSWESSGCLETSDTGAAHISASGEAAYIALGTSTWASEDSGASWSPIGE